MSGAIKGRNILVTGSTTGIGGAVAIDLKPGPIGADMQGRPEPQGAKIAKDEMLKAADVAECVHLVLRRPAEVNPHSVKIIPRAQDHC